MDDDAALGIDPAGGTVLRVREQGIPWCCVGGEAGLEQQLPAGREAQIKRVVIFEVLEVLADVPRTLEVHENIFLPGFPGGCSGAMAPKGASDVVMAVRKSDPFICKGSREGVRGRRAQNIFRASVRARRLRSR